MKSKKDTIKIIEILKEYYPDATCSLDFTTPFEMMISVMLSAQCTDERVNKTTPLLFKKYNTPEALSKIDIKELEDIIHPCGFYKNKAKNIKACSQKLLDEFNRNSTTRHGKLTKSSRCRKKKCKCNNVRSI